MLCFFILNGGFECPYYVVPRGGNSSGEAELLPAELAAMSSVQLGHPRFLSARLSP